MSKIVTVSSFDGKKILKSPTHRCRSTIISVICLFAIFAPQLFFSFGGLIGFEYGGVEESPGYVRYIILIFILMLSTFLISYLKKPKLSFIELGFYLFFFLFIVNHLAWVLFDSGETRLWPANLVFFFSMGVTGFMAARVIHVYDAWPEVIKLAELLIFVMAMGLFVAIVQPYFTGSHIRGVGGASYQAASYYAAICFGMIGLAAFRLDKAYRYKIFRNRISLVLNILLMAALFVAVLINGGRGAFVLLVVYTGLILYWIATKGGWTWFGVFRFMSVLLAVPVATTLILQKIFNDPILAAGWRRAVAFIGSPDGGLIDLEGGSSGRDRVYSVALQGILDSPWIGHGAFGHWEKVIQPHNLFLDLALQFGVLVAMALSVLVIALLFLRLKPLNTEKVWILVLFLYPIVNLMFSGGYLHSSIFWFCLAGILLSASSNIQAQVIRKQALVQSEPR